MKIHIEKSMDLELSRLKSKIIDAIRFSERYWMIYKEKTFGIATILDLTYKKAYIEILFFTNKDVIQRVVPLIKIYTPTETQFNFNEVLIDPDFDKDGLISPIKIIERVNDLIDKEINYHLNVLEKEIQLINEKFENYPIDDNPYFRKILIYFSNYVVKLRINLENYPDIPNLSEKKQLVIKRFKEPLREIIRDKIVERYGLTSFERVGEEIKVYDDKEVIRIEKYTENVFEKFRKRVLDKFRVILKETLGDYVREYEDWEQIIREKDFNNIDIIKNWNLEKPPHIIEVIESILNVKEGSQHLLLNNVSIIDYINNIKLKIHRGQSIGIFYESLEKNQLNKEEVINYLFKTILGRNPNFSGEISVFGNKIQPGIKNKIEGIFIASDEINSEMEYMSIKRAILHNIYIIGKKKSKKKLLNNILKTTGLLNKKKEKISKLSKLDRVLFSISRALLRFQQIILIVMPLSEVGRLESERFNRIMEKIKRKFHVILIIHGPINIVSNCDKIITIKNKEVEIGTIQDFISKIPQSGEIISIELDNPDKNALEKMLEIDSALFIEKRKNERYKIYCTRENPEKIIIKLMASVGDYIYNFKIYKASLEEYLEFLEINQKKV